MHTKSVSPLFLVAVAAITFSTFVGTNPAGAAEPVDCAYCDCNTPCNWLCKDGGYTTTCGAYGVCEDTISCNPCSCGSYTYGTSGDDTLNGNSGNNCIYGGDGDDTINGLAGNDKLYGESGEDSLYGGAGNDCLFGGPNGDYLDGGSDYDELRGNGGPDTCVNGELNLSC